jgi:hypothetical protein
MRPVSELYGRHAGEDIYVIGTGPSIRVFPRSFLDGKVTIGLNMAWRNAPVRYGITIHPDLNVPEFLGETPPCEITWVTPLKKSKSLLTPEQFRFADANFYRFEYQGRQNTQPEHEPSDAGRMIEWVEHPNGDSLYVWSSIAQTGANLAANLGARNVILVGCDNGSLASNHHAHSQHTRWKGVPPEHRYDQYYEGMAEVRAALRRRQVNVVSLQPFLGVAGYEADFARLCAELEVPDRVKSYDVPVAARTPPSLTRRLRARLARALGR